MTPLKAIRAKCLDCCCGQVNEVKYCVCEDCPLWPYRHGHNPARKGVGGKGGQLFKKSNSDAKNVSESVKGVK